MVTGLDEHRRVEQLARQGELHYHDLFDLGRDAVLIIEGADGTIIDANRQALALVRVTSGGLVGRTLPRLCADPTAATALCRSSTDSGVQTLAILTDDGATVDTETTVSWLDLPDGRKVAQVVLRDISDRQRALAEALAGQRAKTAFLATMSHELRTPLNGILGLADVLERGSLDGQQRELMGLLRASAMRLLDLLTNVLEYSRLDSGGSLGELSEFSPRVLVEDLIAGETVVAAAKQIGMEIAIAAEVPAKVLGDPARLRLALHHLVSNAVKFTVAGHVSVNLRIVSRDGVRVRLAFVVTDTGIGIPPDRCNDLFKPFTQIDGSSTRSYEGSGLGLAIVERAITRMGGTVTVTSAIGIGSTFTIEMSFALPA
jgi:signal transduction histidine kinase